jgi:hypothetical protein
LTKMKILVRNEDSRRKRGDQTGRFNSKIAFYTQRFVLSANEISDDGPAGPSEKLY